MDPLILAVVLGTLIGLVMALTGAGGGVMAIPLLVFGLHLPVQQAAPVGLVAVGLAAVLGAALGLRQGIVRYRAAALIGAVGMLVAPLGVLLAQRLPNRPLLGAFALVLIYTAWHMLKRPAQATALPVAVLCRVSPLDQRLTWTRPCARALAATGMTAGLLSGLLGVGGGFVIVPALKRYTDLDIRSIQLTSLAVIALVSLSGVAAAALQGPLRWDVALPFSGGAVLALLAGQRIAKKLDPKRLQQGFAWFSVLVALLMLAKAVGWVSN
ncbi:MAG: sulfite exporter TauE/SafE family protein [Gammaproteobacteria bacterium]|uniref:sulfite exporter TauE/SafE family protein n=1 Tax=Rhodoferax sp. TaxID=50421 RepID=UPI0017EBD74E|nr:sulfite exporter TauE/SafE family protein [Rhodoferax sp.]MBU3899538.1 sulfite exporter TauE/SafE family protein [Gammaproteobacteria bacterium]MBA3059609.1 sulfite exporter TauE/SafE family protein [Rhodoferax sp.]MBU3997093.1 sulfite exporter TauE/SafE family protein [Gammaproteobacteria bacterium]MBU4018014.1 sulfite exporter TauE/SafE family protein [Gammaproteobacteria bacterium]MBU4080295.1 sulfite exporter TauE/SafE family protein [Gammaproteobacteria bacterium]